MNINTQEILDFGRSHTGRALSLFAVLDIIPGISWHDAAIAALSVSAYAFWVRCDSDAEPGETGADVLARSLESRAKQAAQGAAAIVKIPAVGKAIARYPKIEGAIERLLPVVEAELVESAPARELPAKAALVEVGRKLGKDAIAAN